MVKMTIPVAGGPIGGRVIEQDGGMAELMRFPVDGVRNAMRKVAPEAEANFIDAEVAMYRMERVVLAWAGNGRFECSVLVYDGVPAEDVRRVALSAFVAAVLLTPPTP